MEFKEFKSIFQRHVFTMLKDRKFLFTTDIDKDVLWNTYLDSFPEGTNEIYRERREFDCSCCRHFIKSFGNVVAIDNYNTITIWDFETGSDKFQPVVDALAKLIKQSTISDVFITEERVFGTDKNHEQRENGSVTTWEHFRIDLPKALVSASRKTVGSLMAEFRAVKEVFKRSLEEVSEDSIETILDLIAQKSLYKGEEWDGVLVSFLSLHKEYHTLSEDKKDLFCWEKSVEVGGSIGKIKNHSIGVLLTDISCGMNLNDAVKRYEKIVAPSNYKRPKAIFTKKMIKQAQKTLSDLGLLDSLNRRHATIDDIRPNNILFANKDTAKKISGDVFDELQKEVSTSPKRFDKIEEITIDRFVKNVLPNAVTIEALFENRHQPNLVSLIAPQTQGKPFLKWANNFSWAYNGNITDSMKERVKAAGGNVEGVLRFSIQWNGAGDNPNDYDAHCIEPSGNKIYFMNKRRLHPSTGMLDVDDREFPPEHIAVENITWTDKGRMQQGLYHLFVHNYHHKGGRSGFTAEIEYEGEIYSYEYPHDLRYDENVTVAKLKFDRERGIKFIESLPSTTSSKTTWGIQTNQFHPVSVCMFSPNYWDAQTGIGHRHYFFILNGCVNQDRPNGFFNEFLKEDLMEHKRVFEALGGKMRVENSDNQLSGLGFSATKRNSLVCKVTGSFTRTLRIKF